MVLPANIPSGQSLYAQLQNTASPEQGCGPKYCQLQG